MSTSFLLTNIPLLPPLTKKNDHLITPNHSSQTSNFEKHDTTQSSTQLNQTISPNSSSTSTNLSASDHSDCDNDTKLSSTESSSSNLQDKQIVTTLKLENNEAEFFSIIPSQHTTMIYINNTNNNMKKSTETCHGIRSSFKNKFHRSHKNKPDINIDNWNEFLTKTLLQMKQDMNEIVVGFHQTDDEISDDHSSNISENVETTSHLSFCERQQKKVKIKKMVHLFDQLEAVINDKEKFPYPYKDIIQEDNLDLIHSEQQVQSKNLLIQHKPLQYRKIRYKTQRRIIKIRHDLDKLKDGLSTHQLTKPNKELSSMDIENYQTRLKKNLLKARKEIAEYNLIDSPTDAHEENTDQTIDNMKAINSTKQSQTQGHRKNLQRTEDVKKKEKHLISTPFIQRRMRYTYKNREKNENNRPVDSRFDSTTFIDLHKEAEDFFGSHIPFWDFVPDSKSSLSTASLKRHSIDFTLPVKLLVSVSLILEDKIKQANLYDIESDEDENNNKDLFDESNKNGDEFFDCISSPLDQRKSQALSLSNNEQPLIAVNDLEYVEF
ncbi:unnamed protein product [Rotaria sp. Silwood1]|nr:unnamed protein product [Rotaria sp. Silwood1]CAF4668997.1 unnamed protein product [Rotaria sp. Silwood1]